MSSVTGGKDTVVKTKLDNQRRRNDPAGEVKEETAAGPNKDKKKERHEKKKLDNRALVSFLLYFRGVLLMDSEMQSLPS